MSDDPNDASINEGEENLKPDSQPSPGQSSGDEGNTEASDRDDSKPIDAQPLGTESFSEELEASKLDPLLSDQGSVDSHHIDLFTYDSPDVTVGRDFRSQYSTKPVRLPVAIGRIIGLESLRETATRIAKHQLASRLMKPVVVLPTSVYELAILACSAAPNIDSAMLLESFSRGRFTTLNEASLVGILDNLHSKLDRSLAQTVVVHVGAASRTQPYRLANSSLTGVVDYCENNNIHLMLITDIDHAHHLQDASYYSNSSVPPGLVVDYETDFVLEIAASENEEVASILDRLRERLSIGHVSIEQIWNAIRDQTLDQIIASINKKYDETFLGRKEQLFKRSVVDAETRIPAQAAAIFIAAHFPLLTGSKFSQLQEHLCHIILDGWGPPIESDPEIPVNRQPSDDDLERIQLRFDQRSAEPGRLANLGGASVASKYRELYASNATQTLGLIVEKGLTSFPVLSLPEEAVLSELGDLTTTYIRSNSYGDDLRGPCFDLLYRIVAGGQPREFEYGRRRVVRRAGPRFVLDVLANVLDATDGHLLDRAIGDFVSFCLRVLQQPSTEVATHTLSIHQIIAAVAVSGAQHSLDITFLAPYLSAAKPKHRAAMVQRLIGIVVLSLEGDDQRLVELLHLSAKAVSNPPTNASDLEVDFRCQVFLRMVLIWLNTERPSQIDGSRQKGNDWPTVDFRILVPALMHDGFAKYLINVGPREAALLSPAQPDQGYLSYSMSAAEFTYNVCSSILRILYSLDATDKRKRDYINQFARRLDGHAHDKRRGRVTPFEAAERWLPESKQRHGLWQASGHDFAQFEHAIRRWLRALPLAVLMRACPRQPADVTMAFVDASGDSDLAIQLLGEASDSALDDFQDLLKAADSVFDEQELDEEIETLDEKRVRVIEVCRALEQML